MTSSYLSVGTRAAELGRASPLGLAFLPENFAEASSPKEFLERGEAATIRKLLRQENIALDESLWPVPAAGAIHNKSVDWVAPTLFIPLALLSSQPALVSIALNVISNFISEFFRTAGGKKVRVQVVVETGPNGTCKALTYEGDVSGLGQIADAIQRIADE